MLFKRTILQGEPSTFVMELPPYHLPTIRGILFHTWTRLKDFMLRAGQVILVVVVVLSFLNAIGTDGSFGNENSEQSVLSAVSKKVAVVFYPLGLKKDNWPGAVGMFTGLFAKEAVVGTLDTLYTQMDAKERVVDGAPEEPFDFWGGITDSFAAIPAGFEGAMTRHFDGKIGAIAYLLFILIYAPCVATIAAIYRETNLNWAAFSVFYLTLLAWLTSTGFYQLATFARHPASSATWLCVAIVLFGALIAGLKIRSRTLHIQA